MEKWIDLSSIEKDNIGNLIWSTAIGKNLNFKYDDVEGFINIVNKIGDYVDIIYNNKKYNLHSNSIKDCMLKNVVKGIFNYFIYDIGDVIEHRFGSYTILDKFEETKNRRKRRYYKTKCSNCGHENILVQDMFLRDNIGCKGCSNRVAVLGKNTIYDLRKDLLEYITEDVAKKFVPNSGERFDVKCPNCGTIKNMQISNFSKNGIKCPICNDGFSFPEKLLNYIFLKSDIDFIYQCDNKYAEWIGKYKYDFMLKLPIGEVYFEAMGEQHYRNGAFNGILDEVISNDLIKKELVLNNNRTYIALDCRYSDINFILNNLKKSKIAKYIKFEKLNQIEMLELKSNSKLVDCCKYYMNLNTHKTLIEICEELKVSNVTLMNYFKIGDRIFNWFSYDRNRLNITEGDLKSLKSYNEDFIYVFDKNFKFIGKYYGVSDTVENLEKLFNIKFLDSKICSVLKGKRKHHNGLHFLEKPSTEYENYE